MHAFVLTEIYGFQQLNLEVYKLYTFCKCYTKSILFVVFSVYEACISLVYILLERYTFCIHRGVPNY